MELCQTFDLPFADQLSVILFKNIQNGKQLKDHVMKGDVNAALVKPTMIVDPFQLLTAATKAVHSRDTQKMTTRNIHSELLYSLSPTKNISDCFKKFGFDKSDKTLLIAEIHKKGESKMDNVVSYIEGERVTLEEISAISDQSQICKVYKISDKELAVGNILDSVVNRMSSKEFV